MDGGIPDDPKSQVNQFCQNYCKRPVTKEDIVYTTSKFGNEYQTIVKLNCLGGQEYAGNLRTVVKEAEKEAAVQALAAYATEIAALQREMAMKKRKQGPAAFMSPLDVAEKRARIDAGENPAFTPKVKLNSLCMKIAKRFLQKGETIYKCMNVPGGYQATVQLSCLPGDWKDRVWAGHVSDNKQKAEQSAAEIALEQIMQDPEMTEEASKAQPKGFEKGCCKGKEKGESCKGWLGKGDLCKGGDWGKGGGDWGKGGGDWCKGGGDWGKGGGDWGKGGGDWGKAKGKCKGKGWGGKGDWGMGDWGMGDWGMDWSWGPPPWMWGPQGWGGECWSGGGPGFRKKDLPRHRVSEEPVLGEVLEWKGSYAWVRPHEPLQHRAARAHGGKIYIHSKDMGGLPELSQGQTVQFHVYEDGSGLGGEEVTVVSG